MALPLYMFLSVIINPQIILSLQVGGDVKFREEKKFGKNKDFFL
jgi:hypothetical protein